MLLCRPQQGVLQEEVVQEQLPAQKQLTFLMTCRLPSMLRPEEADVL